MKTKEEIINDSIKLETPPIEYNSIEIQCFLALKQLLVMFHNKQITTENASKTKRTILADYEKRCKEYEFQTSMFREHIEQIKNTEMKRTKLRKMLNEKKEATEERIAEMLAISIEILADIFKGEFN